MSSSLQSRLEGAAANEAKNAVISKVEEKVEEAVKSGNIEEAVLGVAVGAGVLGGLFLAEKIHDHSSEAHQKELEDYKLILKKRLIIREPKDRTKKIPFHTVFTTNEMGSNHYSQQTMASWITYRPASNSKLLECDKKIDRAMNQILTCYQKRLERTAARARKTFSFLGFEGKEEDFTSAVLRDLMLKLDDVKGADGYERKIAMLKGLDLAISDFCGNHEFRNTWLKPACTFISDAITDLEQQQEHLSLDNLIDESWPDASVNVRSLLEAITMLVTSEEDWEHIKDASGKSNFDEQLIAKYGLIHQGADHSNLGVSSAPKYLRPKGCSDPLVDNLRNIAQLFSELKPNAPSAKKVAKSKNVTPLKKLDFNKQADKEAILTFFKNTKNFLTSIAIRTNDDITNGQTESLYNLYMEEEKRLQPPSRISNVFRNAPRRPRVNGDNKYAAIIQERVDFLYQLTELTAEATTNVGLQLGISQCAKDRGELFISDPKHATFLFGTVNTLSHQLDSNDGHLIKSLKKIKAEHAACGLSSKQKDLWNVIDDQLVQLKELTSTSVAKLNKHRSKISFLHVRAEVARDDHWAVDIAHDAIARHHLPAAPHKLTADQHAEPANPAPAVNHLPAQPPVPPPAQQPAPLLHVDKPHANNESKYDQQDEHSDEESESEDGYGTDDDAVEQQPSPAAAGSLNPPDSNLVSDNPDLSNLEALLETLRQKIDAINIPASNNQSQITLKQTYNNIYVKLSAISNKATSLSTEHRFGKALPLIKLAYDHCQKLTSEILSKTKDQRTTSANVLLTKLVTEIEGNSQFLDSHKREWCRFFMHTQSRNLVDELKKEYKDLTHYAVQGRI